VDLGGMGALVRWLPIPFLEKRSVKRLKKIVNNIMAEIKENTLDRYIIIISTS